MTVQLESDQVNNAAAHIDESYATVSGGFGSILLGSTKGSTVKMFVGAPAVGGLGLGNTDHDLWIIKPSAVGNVANFVRDYSRCQ